MKILLLHYPLRFGWRRKWDYTRVEWASTSWHRGLILILYPDGLSSHMHFTMGTVNCFTVLYSAEFWRIWAVIFAQWKMSWEGQQQKVNAHKIIVHSHKTRTALALADNVLLAQCNASPDLVITFCHILHFTSADDHDHIAIITTIPASA